MTRRKKSKRRDRAFTDESSLRGKKRGRKLSGRYGRGQEGQDNVFIKNNRVKVTEEDVVGFVISNGNEATQQEILGAFDLGRSHRKILDMMLQDMGRRKIVFFTPDKTYTVLKSQDYLEGELSVNPRGFAFVRLAPPNEHLEDVFVPGKSISTAMHGDLILVKIINIKGRKREGRVVRVLERGSSQIVGIYKVENSVGLVLPEDDRFAFNIRINEEFRCGAKDGEAVVAKIIEHSLFEDSNPKGEIIEVLGDPDSLNVQTEIVIKKFELPNVFDSTVQSQLARIDSKVLPGPDRLDLRDSLHITIDGETARDFDDAVAVVKKDKGYRLYVSIADVSHYVTLGSALDLEAYQRGTSVYFPTRVVPMLPERLSNDLCSLVPNEDRYAFTAILDFDRNGIIKGKQFAKSIIRSKYRMTYNQVKAIIIDKEPAMTKRYKKLVPSLTDMEKLGHALLHQRETRGSIGFELPEAFVEVSNDDTVAGISRRDRNFAHQIIEEFMLAANEAVATILAEKNLTKGLFRVHETPDPVKVSEFSQFATTLGMELPEESGTPYWFGKVLDLAKGSPQEYIVNNLLLRTMKQARYTSENVGHFGLAASHYTHFTSPIRRYPDLMVHRALADFLNKGKDKGMSLPKNKKKKEEGPGKVIDAGDFLSKRERVAVDAEREMVDRLKVRFMEDKIGECFEAIVSGVTSFGLFVELLDVFVSGGVAITDLTDDYYHLDDRNHRLIGKRTNNVIQMGDVLTVKLSSVERARRRINFVIQTENSTLAGGDGQKENS